MFSLGRNKAPGPGGYPAEFFTHYWSVVRTHLTEVVLDFFHHGKLLKEISNTTIALVPKILNPSSQADYRPVSYYNVVYKSITKILENWL